MERHAFNNLVAQTEHVKPMTAAVKGTRFKSRDKQV